MSVRPTTLLDVNARDRRKFETEEYERVMGRAARQRQEKLHEQLHTCDCHVPGKNHAPECAIWKGRRLAGAR